ncbi:hypothetical protein L1987_51116 [Smallanthus sonchifolius]|uniref:Uncharacterized protein n=1 Tax=Smallanthus sonchifolius TaxID=185202 RepID=A0ACB9EPD0_9ASTR|nr:hypothetical protein L1987_51116 [Smallanthus sonchifolius]
MSWLARSIANTLLIDDDDDDRHRTSPISDHNRPQFSKEQLHIHQQLQNLEIKDHDPTGSVKEDLSEFTETLTRQLRGVASFLAPPPPPPAPPIRHHSTEFQPDLSVSDRDDGDPYLSGEDDDRVSNPTCDQIENVEAVGVREEALAFARNISHHPETWLDFPLSEEEDDDDFEMSDTQWNHVTLVERLAPRLAALRIELCPIHMSESYFWKVYFVLLHPRLNKHDADLLSTPQIVAARSMWMKELQKRTKPRLESSETNTYQSHHDFSTATELPSASTSFEPTTDYTVTSENSVSQEVGSTKTPLDHIPACSYTIPVEEDDDDWIYENSELNGYVGPDVQFETDEDISFSDLEADDDCTMPIRSQDHVVKRMS